MKQFLVICSVLALAYAGPSPQQDESAYKECFKNLSSSEVAVDKILYLEQDLKDYNSSGDLYYLYFDAAELAEEVLYNVEDCKIPGLPNGQNLSDLLYSKYSECVVKKAEQENSTGSFIQSVESLVQSYLESNEIEPEKFAKVLLDLVNTFYQLEEGECNNNKDWHGNAADLNSTDCFSFISGGAFVQETFHYVEQDLLEINNTGIVDLDLLHNDVIDLILEVLFAYGECKQDIFLPTVDSFNDFINKKNSSCLIEKAEEKNQNEVFVSNVKDLVDDYYGQNYELKIDVFIKFVEDFRGFFFNGDECNLAEADLPIWHV